jgi:S-adenosylhomocysteine hydrolase
MKDGAMLVNAEADFGEWDPAFLRSKTSIRLTDKIVKFRLQPGKHLLALGGGNSYNLVSGISISNFLDITFSLAILAIDQFARPNKNLHGHLVIADERLQELNNRIYKLQFKIR